MGDNPFIDIVVKDEGLHAALDTLSKNVRNKVMRPAIRNGMKKIGKAAKANTPVKTGKLKKSVKTAVKKSRINGEVYGVLIGGAPHAHLIEYGYNHITKNGTKHVPARPFLRPAMDAHHDEAIQDIAIFLEKEWKEIGGR